MKLLIEEYRYPFDLVKELFPNIDELDVVDGVASINYVGYFYHAARQECVFILPKVVLDQNDKVFGKYDPKDIIDINGNNPLTTNENKFIYGLSVWIYRAISVYLSDCIARCKDHTIVKHQKLIKVGKGKKRLSNTYLDILLALIDFNRQNRDWFMFILKNIHSGYNKINWNKTITRSQAIVQDDEPVYINPVTKKRHINFDEELLIIFYSILNYLKEFYGFHINFNVNYDLITGRRFNLYLNKGGGLQRLRQIKYKYFSDKALQLWELCYAFFEQSSQVRMNAQINEFLLVKNFNIVFEAIIDELIGDTKLPDRLNKKQADGKEVDHIYLWNSLTNVEPNKQVYYIGDSKYYKQKNEIGLPSIAKQYTYARNVIQWNLNLFFGENADETPHETDFCLRDELTEGYNVVPNFFISATIPDNLQYDDNIDETKRSAKTHVSRQFKNRLFDRDTLLITHYDVNFLYVVSLYARNNAFQKRNWKQKVRNIFRDKIREELGKRYNFYAMRAKPDIDTKQYIETHFRDILGKVFAPYADKEIISLALDNREEFAKENADLLTQLSNSFKVVECNLGQDPRPLLPPTPRTTKLQSGKQGILMVMMESYTTRSANFAASGKLAIGIKYTERGMEIINNLSQIGYILFHTWNKSDQRLFAIKGDCQIVAKPAVPEDYYMTPKNPTHPDGTPDEAQFLYILLTADMNTTLDTTNIDCNKKKYTSQKERYDAQFARIEELL